MYCARGQTALLLKGTQSVPLPPPPLLPLLALVALLVRVAVAAALLAPPSSPCSTRLRIAALTTALVFTSSTRLVGTRAKVATAFCSMKIVELAAKVLG